MAQVESSWDTGQRPHGFKVCWGMVGSRAPGWGGVSQAQHCQLGEGRNCPTLFCCCGLNFITGCRLGATTSEGHKAMGDHPNEGCRDGMVYDSVLAKGAADDFSPSLLSCLLLFQVKDASTQTALPTPTSPRNEDPS